MWSKYPEIQNELLWVEKFLTENVRSRNQLLTDIVKELIEAGGKRLRPAFVVLAGKMGSYQRKKIVPMAAALEILHTATLVHDDIVDRARIRRGKCTVCDKYGMDMAVYTGDFLFTKAVLMLSENIPKGHLTVVAKAIKSICEGEVDQYKEKFNVNASMTSYLKRISRKTAVLFSAACGTGAYLSKCNPAWVKQITRFGFCYGMAFQIRDDMNDFMLNEKESGKPVGKDLSEGVITLPVLCIMNHSEEIKNEVTHMIHLKKQMTKEHRGHLVQLVIEHGGLKKAEMLMDKYIERGLHALQKIPESNSKRIFSDLIRGLRISAKEDHAYGLHKK